MFDTTQRLGLNIVGKHWIETDHEMSLSNPQLHSYWTWIKNSREQVVYYRYYQSEQQAKVGHHKVVKRWKWIRFLPFNLHWMTLWDHKRNM